jgi:Flp pilus assembly protein TadG
MMQLRRNLDRLKQDQRGSMVIETAVIVPVLAMLSLGAFDASRMIARQTELQQAVAEAAQISLASTPDTQSERNTIKSIIQTSTGLATSNVTITNKYRCGALTTLSDTNNCGSSSAVTTYLKVVVTDTYTPLWNDFGIGSAINYNVERMVVIS